LISKEEIEKSAQVIAAAYVIAGDKPPCWLVTGIGRAVIGLHSAITAEQNHPNRNELRERLGRLHDAAQLLANELEDGTILSFLEKAAPSKLNLDGRIVDTLRTVGEVAKAAAEAVPTGKGRQKHYPRPEGLTPFQTCAIYVVLAWREIRGSLPRATVQEAQAACELLWRATGVERVRWGRTNAAWRGHIEAVIPLCDGLAAQVLISHLTADRKRRGISKSAQ